MSAKNIEIPVHLLLETVRQQRDAAMSNLALSEARCVYLISLLEHHGIQLPSGGPAQDSPASPSDPVVQQ